MNWVIRAMGVLIVLIWAGAMPAMAQAPATDNAIEAITVARQGVDLAVRIDFKTPPSALPTGFTVTNPAKIALDFASTANALGKNGETLNYADLHSYNLVQVGNRTRLVLNLMQGMNYISRIEDKSVYITLSPVGRNENSKQEDARFRPEDALGNRHAIHDILFRRGKDGEGRILVDLSDPGAGIDVRQQGQRLIVDFMKTKLPEHLRKTLDVDDFATPVSRIETRDMGENVRMTITPKGLWEHSAYQSDNQFVLEVKRIVEDPNKLVQGTKIGYQGPRASVRYQGEVRALLRLLAEELGFNAVISESVQGETTINLNDVPVDQIIDVIFQQKGLDMRKNGNVLMIATRDEISLREKTDFAARQEIGDLEPLRTEAFQINYQKADAIQKLLTDSNQRMLSKRGSAVVDPRTNTLFVQDTPARLESVRQVVTRVDVPVRQVMIEARIVIASDSFAKDLGVRLGFLNRNAANLGGSNKLAVGTASTETFNAASASPVTSLSQNVNLPASPSKGTAGVMSFMLYNSKSLEFLSLEVSALESDGRGKVISSPRVMTADQVEAIIEEGVEIPYQSATSSGATSVSFRKANLSLKVKPQITPDGKITLSLDVNKDSKGDTVTAGVLINTKHVKTEVLVESGGTVVIGGIYTQETSNAVNKIPVLGDLPVLGGLFRNSSVSNAKSELLIFVTPKIVSEKLGLN